MPRENLCAGNTRADCDFPVAVEMNFGGTRIKTDRLKRGVVGSVFVKAREFKVAQNQYFLVRLGDDLAGV